MRLLAPAQLLFSAAVLLSASWLATDYSKFALVPYGIRRIDGILSDVSQTALLVAHCRSFAHMLGYVDDPIVRSLLPAGVVMHELLMLPRPLIMKHVEDPLGIFGWIVSRTNVIDSFVRKGMQEISGSGGSVIVLGAGFDTRAYRLAVPDNIRLFEVDSPPTQRAKKAILESKGFDTSNVTYVSVDFNQENFLERLLQEGFDVSKPAIITWEGVIPYLQESALNSTLETIVKEFATGSVLIVTFVNEVPSSEEELSNVYGRGEIFKTIKNLGEPSTFRMPQGNEKRYMESFGFHVLSHLNTTQLEAMYFSNHGDKTRVGGLFNIMALETLRWKHI